MNAKVLCFMLCYYQRMNRLRMQFMHANNLQSWQFNDAITVSALLHSWNNTFFTLLYFRAVVWLSTFCVLQTLRTCLALGHPCRSPRNQTILSSKTPGRKPETVAHNIGFSTGLYVYVILRQANKNMIQEVIFATCYLAVRHGLVSLGPRTTCHNPLCQDICLQWRLEVKAGWRLAIVVVWTIEPRSEEFLAFLSLLIASIWVAYMYILEIVLLFPVSQIWATVDIALAIVQCCCVW